MNHYDAVALAEGLVNSHLPSGEHVSLADPAAVDGFLDAYGVQRDRRSTNADVKAVAELRTRLRAVFEAGDDDDVAALLTALLDEAGATPRLVPGATGITIDHVPPRASLPKRLAVVTAMALAEVVVEEGSDRLRVCDWGTCPDVFVDRSRNRSRRFCKPEVCGNRAAVAAWRARQRAPGRRSR